MVLFSFIIDETNLGRQTLVADVSLANYNKGVFQFAVNSPSVLNEDGIYVG